MAYIIILLYNIILAAAAACGVMLDFVRVLTFLLALARRWPMNRKPIWLRYVDAVQRDLLAPLRADARISEAILAEARIIFLSLPARIQARILRLLLVHHLRWHHLRGRLGFRVLIHLRFQVLCRLLRRVCLLAVLRL